MNVKVNATVRMTAAQAITLINTLDTDYTLEHFTIEKVSELV